MKRRFSDEQIIGMIKEYEAGVKAQDLCRKYGISDATFYKYKAKFGGMNVSDAKKLRALEDEVADLKRDRSSTPRVRRSTRAASSSSPTTAASSPGGSRRPSVGATG